MGARLRDVKSNEVGLKKRLGQHFLRDTGVIDRIVRWIAPGPGDVFFEIGAGDGALSRRLAPAAKRLVAMELDADCIERLQGALSPFPAASVIQGDVLQADPAELFPDMLGPGARLRIVGNLPYNIASAIIDRMLHLTLPVCDMRFMVQFEVAERITAAPGSREYGFLSVHFQHHAEIAMGFKVSPSCFVPRPKVSSAMISLHPKAPGPNPRLEADFVAFAKAAFSYRRKTLENSLARHPDFGKIAPALLQRAGIDGTRRAEQLSVAEYEHLAELVGAMRSTG